MKSDKLIFCAYAEDNRKKSGENLAKERDVASIYWKNCIVALWSVKTAHPEVDVAVVTNTIVPSEYLGLFKKKNIIVFHENFDTFTFEEEMRWGLAFYKLCALQKMIEKKYEYYLMLDTDVYMQSRIDDLFEEMNYKVLLYDRHPRLSNLKEGKNNREIKEFTGRDDYITKWGGEFVAGKKDMLLKFIGECKCVYERMNAVGFHTNYGDEFIISLAANKLSVDIKNANGYMERYWTGTFRYVNANYMYDAVSVLHVPAEKNDGMIKIYNCIRSKNDVPLVKNVHRLLHLKRPSIQTIMKMIIKKLIEKVSDINK